MSMSVAIWAQICTNLVIAYWLFHHSHAHNSHHCHIRQGWQGVLQDEVERIVTVYRRNGRFDVKVDPKVITLPQNRVDIVFEIAEGENTEILSINFIGDKFL